MGKQDTFPTDWETQGMAWISKQGKTGGRAKDRRGITIVDSSAKAYLIWLHRASRAKMETTWRNDEYGAVPGRSTTQALLKILALRKRLRRAKVSSFLFLGDAVKAFDRIRRDKVMSELTDRIGEPDLERRIRARHRKVVARTQWATTQLDMHVRTGVPQGDPNGPTLFVAGYGGSLKELDRVREEKNFQEIELHLPSAHQGEGTGEKSLKVSKTVFVDDHSEVHKLRKPIRGKWKKTEVVQQISNAVVDILEAQEQWGISSGKEKTEIQIDLIGKGSGKVMKEIGDCIELTNGTKIKIAWTSKYLGTMIGTVNDGNKEDLDNRIEKANKAMNRLGKIWRTPLLAIKEKIQVYKTLVTTVLLYAAETREFSPAQLARLESLQMRHIRRISNTPTHLTLESNVEVRTRLVVPSITSSIAKKLMSFLVF